MAVPSRFTGRDHPLCLWGRSASLERPSVWRPPVRAAPAQHLEDRVSSPATVGEQHSNRVLFVSEDASVVEDLQEVLPARRPGWELAFYGRERALAQFDAGPVDVIVTDLRVSGLDTPGLLARVQEQSPATIRIVLSGRADAQAFTRVAIGAHRFVAEPDGIEALIAVLDRSFALSDIGRTVELYRGATGASTLPSCPGVYHEIAAATADPLAGADAIARIIERDPAMTAKVFQVANSAFYGMGRRVGRVREAVSYLGTETLAALAVSAQAFAELEPTLHSTRFSRDAFQRHSTLVAWLAGRIIDCSCRPRRRGHRSRASRHRHARPAAENPWRWETTSRSPSSRASRCTSSSAGSWASTTPPSVATCCDSGGYRTRSWKRLPAITSRPISLHRASTPSQPCTLRMRSRRSWTPQAGDTRPTDCSTQRMWMPSASPRSWTAGARPLAIKQ